MVASPAGSPPPQTVVVHETLANLSRLPPELIELIERFCRGEKPANYTATAAEKPMHVGPCYGVLAGLHALARELGIVRAVGEATRTQRLALYMIYARFFLIKGSRLVAAGGSEKPEPWTGSGFVNPARGRASAGIHWPSGGNRRMNSARRFFFQAISSWLGSAGLSSPQLRVRMRSPEMP